LSHSASPAVLAFWGTSILLSIAFVLIYISTNSIQVFLFITSSPVFIVVCGMYDSHSDCNKVKSQFSFDFHFLYGQGCWAFVHVFTGHLYFWELSVQFIYPFICWVIWVLSSCMFWLLIPY
jgi:hypothetical protein